jgi:hypothetical protein
MLPSKKRKLAEQNDVTDDDQKQERSDSTEASRQAQDRDQEGPETAIVEPGNEEQKEKQQQQQQQDEAASSRSVSDELAAKAKERQERFRALQARAVWCTFSFFPAFTPFTLFASLVSKSHCPRLH